MQFGAKRLSQEFFTAVFFFFFLVLFNFYSVQFRRIGNSPLNVTNFYEKLLKCASNNTVLFV